MTSPPLPRSTRQMIPDEATEEVLCEAEQAIVDRWKSAGMGETTAKILLAGLTHPEMREHVRLVVDLTPTRL